MIPMPTNTFATEQGWEALAFWNHFLRNARVAFRFWLADDEFSDLDTLLARSLKNLKLYRG
jgi:hypothetical protein